MIDQRANEVGLQSEVADRTGVFTLAVLAGRGRAALSIAFAAAPDLLALCTSRLRKLVLRATDSARNTAS